MGDRRRAPRIGHAASDRSTRPAGPGLMLDRLRYRDDRGELLDGRPPLAMAAARRAGIDPKTARAALRPLRRVGLAFWALMLAMIVLGPALVFVLAGWGARGAMMIIPATAPIVPVLALAPWLRPLGWRLHRRGLLSLGLCPACGYPITEIEPQADGCRVCPECAAAWRMDDSIESGER